MRVEQLDHTADMIRIQMSSSRLEAGNQMVLGGPNGVRAYTTVDGLGDHGALLSLGAQRRWSSGHSVGFFYDGGRIKLLNPQATEPQKSHRLEALGTEIRGPVSGGIYNLTMAKGMGGYKGWNSTNIESKPNNWRFFASIHLFLH